MFSVRERTRPAFRPAYRRGGFAVVFQNKNWSQGSATVRRAAGFAHGILARPPVFDPPFQCPRILLKSLKFSHSRQWLRPGKQFESRFVSSPQSSVHPFQ